MVVPLHEHRHLHAGKQREEIKAGQADAGSSYQANEISGYQAQAGAVMPARSRHGQQSPGIRLGRRGVENDEHRQAKKRVAAKGDGEKRKSADNMEGAISIKRNRL